MSEATPETAARQKKGKGKLVPILAAVIVLAGALFGAKAVLGGRRPKSSGPHAVKVGSTLQLDEFLVNLAGPGDHYLRATIALGLKEGVSEDDAKAKVAPIRDAILGVLSSETRRQLSTESGREALKTAIAKQVNDELGDNDVVKVYFMALATQ